MKNKFQSNGLIRMLLGHSKDQSLGFPRQWKVIASTLLLLFTLGIGQMWGANGDVLFSQDFNSATAVSQNLGDAAVDIDKDSENNIFGNTAASQFTSLKAAKISNAKGGLAINAKVSSNSVEYDYSKKFGFRSDDTKASFHLVKKTNFATTAPTALKIEMTMYYQQLSSGSNVTASFAIGDSFNDKEKPANANIHSGFTIKGNGTATFCQFGTTTNLTGYATKMTQGSEVEVTWVINNTGSTLKYTDPNGEESSLDNDKFDVWVGTTKNVAGAPATSASKSLQNLYIGDCDAKKKFEFYLNDIKVTDLTPCLEPSITTQPSGASLPIGDANPELSVVASNTTSYAWKESSNGTSYDGSSSLGTSKDFTPSVNTAAQTKYYYCELVNSCNTSNVVKTNIVTVNVVASAVNVTGVSLDKTSQEFTLGATTTTTLTATVAPNDATNKAISWESSAPTKVSVTDNGDGTADIEGLAEGTATITVTTDDGSYTATCNVTVHPDPCFAWGYGTSNTTAPSSGNSVTIGSKLTIANVGSSTSNEAPFAGATAVGSIATNGASKYLTGTLGGDVIESVTFSVYTSDASKTTYMIAFASSATYDAANAITLPNGYTSYAYADAPAKTGERKTVVVTAPAGAKSFAISRNLSGVTYDSEAVTMNNSGNRNIYYIQACPHVCDGTAATKYNVTGTTSICEGGNADVTLANSQSGAKYVLLKDAAEVDGSEKNGTGSDLVWNVSETGTYTVKAIEYGDYCETAMNGSAVISEGAKATIATAAQTIYVGGATLTMELTETAEGAWESSAPAKATITNAGVVTAVAAGTTDITFTKTGGCPSAAVTITVANPIVVSFDVAGGTAIDNMSYVGAPLTLPTAVNGTKQFMGWYEDSEFNTAVTLDGDGKYTPSTSHTIYAKFLDKSDIKTLATLTLNGVTITGFEADKTSYEIELPYKTVTAPTVAATAADAPKASVGTITQATLVAGEGTASFTVTAEDESTQDYTIHFTVMEKDMLHLIGTTVTGDKAHGTVYGYGAGTAAVKVSSKDGEYTYKFNKGNYVGVTLADGLNFQAGDIVKIRVFDRQNATGFTLYTTNAADSVLIMDTRTNTVIENGIHELTLPNYAGSHSLYLLRADNTTTGNMNLCVDSIAVYRSYPKPVLTAMTINGEAATIDNASSTKTITAEVPYNTDFANMTLVETFMSNDPTQTTGLMTGAWIVMNNQYEGSYVVTDKDGDTETYAVTLTKAPHYEAQIGSTKCASLVAAVAAAQADDVVKLLDNVDLMATGLTIAENITLDLNGFNIKAGEQIDNDIVVPAGKKLTLVDNSANAEGKIYTEQAYTGAVTGYGLIRVAGELLMQSGNIYAVIESDPANLGQFAVVLGAGGKATIEGGQIKAGWYAISNNGNNTGSTIIVSGGELISTADFAIYNPAKESTVTVTGGVVYGAAGGIAMNRGELTVTGGTITSKDQGTTGTWGDGTGGMSNAAISASGKYESVEVEITGGTIIAEGTAVMITNGTTNPVEVAISGGQFSHVVPAEYCADGFAPVTTPNAQGKYEVIPVGIIHGPAVQDPTTEVYSYTLDNDVTIFSSESDGRLKTSNHIATSSDVVACGGDNGGYNVNKGSFVLQFPVNVKEFTIYGANSTERTISKVYVNAEASKTIKISTDGRQLTGTYTNTKDEKCQTLTAEFTGENIISANDYVLINLSGSVNMYRILYTEAECTDPVITAVNNAIGTVGESATVSVEATALGATYQWYTCDENGDNAEIIGTATAASYTFTKGTGVEYFKVVVGNNCNTATVSAVAKAEVWAPTTTLVDVTENTTWDWTLVTQNVDGTPIDASNGPKLNTTNGMIIGNYIIGNNFDKVEGNDGAFAIRHASNKYYQGASLHMHTTVSGYLKIHARNDGNTMTLSVQNAGRDMSLGSLGNWKDYTVYVQAGDVVIYNVPETAGKPMRIDHMEFTVDETPDYTRTVSNNIGTLCVDHNVVAGGALGATFYQIASRNEEYDYKIDFEEVLPGEELKAGEPYIFQSATGRIDLFFGETEAPAPVAVRGMIGNYAAGTLAITEDNQHTILYIAQNKLWTCENLVGQNLILNDHRAYIDMTQVPTYAEYQASLQPQQGNAPRRRVTLGKDAEQTTTGVDNLNASEQPVKLIIDGQLFIIRGEKMFDATGRLVK